MGGDLPCRHGEAAFYLVSLAQHTGVSSGSSTAEGCHRIISGFGFFHPCEGITVIKFNFNGPWAPLDYPSVADLIKELGDLCYDWNDTTHDHNHDLGDLCYDYNDPNHDSTRDERTTPTLE